MDKLFSSLVNNTFFSDPFINKLILVIILFLGISQAFRIVWAYVNKLKGIKEKEVIDEEKGKWKKAVINLTEEVASLGKIVKNHDDRATDIHEKIRWLYDVHNKFDDDGVPKWYVRQSLEKAIEALANSIEKQTRFFSSISVSMNDIRRDISDIKDNK